MSSSEGGTAGISIFAPLPLAWEGGGEELVVPAGSCFLFFSFFKIIYFWLHWVFVAVRRLSLVAESFVAVRGLLIAVASR